MSNNTGVGPLAFVVSCLCSLPLALCATDRALPLEFACGALSAKLAHVEDLGSGPGLVILLLKRERARAVETDRGQMMNLVRPKDRRSEEGLHGRCYMS